MSSDENYVSLDVLSRQRSPGSPSKLFPVSPSRLLGNKLNSSIGLEWTIELNCLKQTGTIFEVSRDRRIIMVNSYMLTKSI
jgi:hypothetical protein